MFANFRTKILPNIAQFGLIKKKKKKNIPINAFLLKKKKKESVIVHDL